MPLQSLTLSNEPSPPFSPEKEEALVLCSKLKCDTTIQLSVSLNGKDWIETEATRDRILHLNPNFQYKAQLRVGLKQVEPVILQFTGSINEEKPTPKRAPEAPKRDPKPVAGGVQLRRPSPRNNPSSSSDSPGKA